MNNYTVKYTALNDIVGRGLLTTVLKFTKALIYELLKESDYETKDVKFLPGARPYTSEDFKNINVEDIHVKNGKQLEGTERKNPEFDVNLKVSSNPNLRIDIELQNKKTNELDRRINYYTDLADIIGSKVGMNYGDMSYSLSIWLMNFSYLGKPIKTFYRMTNELDAFGYSRLIIVDLTEVDNCVNIELRNYLKLLISNDLSTLYKKDDDIMAEAIKYIVNTNADEDTLYDIEQAEKARLQYNTDIKYAKDEGLAEGLAKGKAENQAEMIISMYQNGLDMETIKKVSKLDEAEIKKILNI